MKKQHQYSIGDIIFDAFPLYHRKYAIGLITEIYEYGNSYLVSICWGGSCESMTYPIDEIDSLIKKDTMRYFKVIE